MATLEPPHVSVGSVVLADLGRTDSDNPQLRERVVAGTETKGKPHDENNGILPGSAHFRCSLLRKQ